MDLQTALPESEYQKLYKDFVENSQELFWQCDNEGRYTYLNRAWETTLGYRIEEMLGRKFTEFLAPDTLHRDIAEFSQLLQGYTTKGYETVHLGKSGTRVHLLINARGVLHSDGTALGTRGTAHDITDRKRAEEELRKSEIMNRSIIESSPMGIHLYELRTDGNLVFIGANPAADRILNVDNSMFIGKSIEEAFPSLAATEVPTRYREVAQTGIIWETEQVDAHDNAIQGAFHIVAFKTGSNMMAVMFLDISARKKTEVALRKSEEHFKAIFNSTFQFTGLMTPDGTLVEANKAALDFAGTTAEDTIGKPFWESRWWTGNKGRVKQFKAAIAQAVTGKFVRYEVDLQGVGATPALIDFSLKPVFDDNGEVVLLVFEGRDITELTKMEAELQRTQKLESLGLLAGGIAHDFNNLMGGIFGYIDLALECSNDATVSEYLGAAVKTINRARGLTQQLLTFAKGGSPIMKVGSISPCITDAVHFALSGSNVSCTFNLSETLVKCNFDRNQISQVIDNIVINAQHAMPTGGHIEVSAENVAFGNEEHPVLAAGMYAKISIKDHGIGIPHDLLPHIFDPFFTTKSRGHGLGLATCFSIVKRHGGIIDVDSEPGAGSTFHIYLPAANGDEPVEVAAAEVIHHGSGCIIVMDDEDVILDIGRKMLATFGYTVQCAANGNDALDWYHRLVVSGTHIAGVILDLTVPGSMGGIETVRELRKMDKNIPVFVSSGYADDPVMQYPAEYGFTASISKPFVRKELAKMLSGYIGGNSLANSNQ